VCTYGGDYISVELIPCENDGISAAEAGESVAGNIFVRLSLIGENTRPANSVFTGDDDIDWSLEKIERNIDDYQDRVAKAHQDTFQLARSWFSRARREFPFLEDRKIKIVAEDECGRHRFVCGFISPDVQTPRSIDGPRFAARFVSLIPFKRDVSLSGERVSTWHSAQCTAIRLQGDVEDHALLLCSILLSWGMDAWVCYGTIYDMDGGAAGKKGNHTMFRPHYWVVTLDDLHEGRLVFWESLTGQQYNVTVDRNLKVTNSQDGDDEHPFREVFALFRHDAFLLNTQRFAIVSPAAIESESTLHAVACNFNLNDSRTWLQFPFQGSDYKLLRHPGSDVVLCDIVPRSTVPSSSSSSVSNDSGNQNCSVDEEFLEAALKDAIRIWRAESGLQTRFDDSLGLVLQPALAAYELDRATGVTFGNQDFQAAIKSKVLKGETFKAYPTCFGHADALSIITALKLTGAVQDIVLSRSEGQVSNVVPEGTRLAVRVKIIPYPEGCCACWVMVAVCRSASK
jgi:centrosomal protein CEP76